MHIFFPPQNHKKIYIEITEKIKSSKSGLKHNLREAEINK